MADMTKMDLVGSMYMIIGILGAYGAYKVISFVYLLIIGATANVATSGDIAMPDILFNVTNVTSGATAGTVVDVLNSVETGFASFITAELVVIGLISLVVIIKIFWPLISSYLPNRKGGIN